MFTLTTLTTMAAWPANLSAGLPAGFQQTAIFGGTGLVDAVAVRFAPDGRVFVAERRGTIQVFDGIDDPSPTLVADLTTNVYNAWDRGLLGLAIHPNFPAAPYIYVLYTHDARIGETAPLWGDACPDPPGFTGTGCDLSSRLSRLELSGDVMIGAEDVLLEAWCQQFPSHSVGDLHFGPDGALYVTHGDGASFNFEDFGQVENLCSDPPFEGGALRSQDIATSGDPVDFDGTLLRVDDAGLALPDNPLFGGADSDDDRIVAYGLRNPYRFTVRQPSGELWIGDVGWGTWEEINRVVDPTDAIVDNFGWPCYEGAPVQGGYDAINLDICEDLYAAGTAIDPYYAYTHTTSSAITGLAFYAGGSYPPEYDGALFFGDFSAGWIRVMFTDGSGDPDPGNIQDFSTFASPVDMQIGPGGDLYYVEYDRFGPEFVYRVRFFTDNQPPVAVAGADVTSGPAPLTVNFDASASFDPDPKDTLTYAWDLDGDGVFDDATGPTAQRTYEAGGSVLVSVEVSDAETSTIDGVLIAVDNSPPVVTIISPTQDTTWSVGDIIDLQGFATDPDEGLLAPAQLLWDVTLHHCLDLGGGEIQCHQHFVQEFFGVDEAAFSAIDHEYPSFLEITLTAFDSGQSDWYDTSWLRRRRVTFDNSGQSEHLFDFPVMLQLDASRIDYGITAGGGADLRFVDRDGTLLAHDIEAWNPGGTSIVWVAVPRIDSGSAADFMWMYYGNGSAPDAQDAAAVWSANYAGVWHLSDSDGNFEPTAGGATLQNPGFESGLASWGTFGNVFAEGFDPHTGALHLKMFGQFTGEPNFSFVYQDVPAAPGQVWRLDAFTEHINSDTIADTANHAEMKLEFRDGADNLKSASGQIILNEYDPQDTWIDNGAVEWLAPPDTTTARALLTFVQPLGEGGAAFYDDVSLSLVGHNATFDIADATAGGSGGLSSGTTLGAGRLGGGRFFDGDDAISLGTPPALSFGGTLTVEAWVKISDPDVNAFIRIVSKKDGWDAMSGFDFEYNPGQNFLTILGSGADFGRAENVDLDSTWHHVAATIIGTQARLFVDGVDVTTDNTVDPLVANAQALMLGRSGGGGAYYQGDLDEVRLSNVARSAAWIAAQYKSMSNTFLEFGPDETRSILMASTSVELQPNTTSLLMESVPPGLELTIYGAAQTTPFKATAISLANVVVSAPSPQELDGVTYTFQSWSDGGAQTHNYVVPETNTTLTATFVAEGCDIGPCADADNSGARDDICAWWACLDDTCIGTDITFADMGGSNGACSPDGAADGNDRFHALNCFSDQNTLGEAEYACEESPPIAYNVDAGGPFGSCIADGVCDGNDAFHALNAFEGLATCSCPNGPAPQRPVERPNAQPAPRTPERAALAVRAARSSVRPGELLTVDVVLDSALQDVRGYQLHARAGGGDAGRLELVDILIEQPQAFAESHRAEVALGKPAARQRRTDQRAKPHAAWSAFNISTHQMVVGTDGPGRPLTAGTVLATLVWRATADAGGTFTVDLAFGDEPGARTFLFPTPADGRIEIGGVRAAQVTVTSKPDGRVGRR